jgi:colicin import membrane protein
MKRFAWMMLMVGLPLAGVAQNTWEKPEKKQEAEKMVEAAKPNPDEKYLRGAVPMENGKVVFRKVMEAPGKTAFQIYNIIGQFLQDETREENQLNSHFVKADTTDYELGASYEEWLVFHSNALVLDRTRFYYVLRAHCQDGKAEIEMSHIKYLYEEERNPIRYKAEDCITDEEAVNKKNTKLQPIVGKFRRKTIDRKDYLFNKLENLLK